MPGMESLFLKAETYNFILMTHLAGLKSITNHNHLI